MWPLLPFLLPFAHQRPCHTRPPCRAALRVCTLLVAQLLPQVKARALAKLRKATRAVPVLVAGTTALARMAVARALLAQALPRVPVPEGAVAAAGAGAGAKDRKGTFLLLLLQKILQNKTQYRVCTEYQ